MTSVNATLVSIMAQIAAAQARVAGMDAENVAQLQLDRPPAYRLNDFLAEAQILETLSVKATTSA